jgi:hypothetical protein
MLPSVALGVPWESPATARTARAVVGVSTLMALVALVSVALQLASASYYSVGVVSAVVLPLCGLVAARRRSRPLLRCYVVCAACEAVAYVLGAFATLVILGDVVSCACDPGCRAKHDIPAGDARVCANQHLYRALWWVGMGLGFAMAALQLAGAYYGATLLRAQEFDAYAVPVAREATVLPPAYYHVLAQPPPPPSYEPPYTARPPPPYAAPPPPYAPTAPVDATRRWG